MREGCDSTSRAKSRPERPTKVFGYLGMFISPCVANNVSPASDKRLEVLKAAVLKLHDLGLRNQRRRCSGSKKMVGNFRSRTSSRRRPALILAAVRTFCQAR